MFNPTIGGQVYQWGNPEVVSREHAEAVNMAFTLKACEVGGIPCDNPPQPRVSKLKWHRDVGFVFAPPDMKPFKHTQWTSDCRQEALFVYEAATVIWHFNKRASRKDSIVAAVAYHQRYRPNKLPCYGKVIKCGGGKNCTCTVHNPAVAKANIPVSVSPIPAVSASSSVAANHVTNVVNRGSLLSSDPGMDVDDMPLNRNRVINNPVIV